MYFSVGKSSGSHPTFLDPEGWYTLTCSTYCTMHAHKTKERTCQLLPALFPQSHSSLALSPILSFEVET